MNEFVTSHSPDRFYFTLLRVTADKTFINEVSSL
jgi:hypothetical protein